MISRFYKHSWKIVHCRVCREQFYLVRKSTKAQTNFSSRLAACNTIYMWHTEVNKRLLLLDPTCGMPDVYSWMNVYSSSLDAELAMLVVDFWDDLACTLFCIKQSDRHQKHKRCRELRRYGSSCAKLFFFLSRQPHLGALERTVWKYHAKIFDRYFAECRLFTNTAEYFDIFVRMFKYLANKIGLCPPWLLSALEEKTSSRRLPWGNNDWRQVFTPHECMRYFMLRYLPVVATRAVIVTGSKKGMLPGPDDTEAEHPTGCR